MDASATYPPSFRSTPALSNDQSSSNAISTRTDIIPVLHRISAALNGYLPIPETAFVMTCKRIQTLLLFSVGQGTTAPQQIALVGVVENVVITFVLRVFPSIVKHFAQPTFSWLSSPLTLISLLEAVDTHICKYADFTLQLRMAAIYQLLRDNEQVAMLFPSSTIPNATPQPYSLELDSSFSELFASGTPQIHCQTRYPVSQQLELPKSSVPVIRSCQNLSEPLRQSLSEATMSLHNQLPPPFSRSCSALSVQGSPSAQSASIKQALLQDTIRILSPSLFTPDSNAYAPTRGTETPTSLAAPDSPELQQASSCSSPLSDVVPQPQAQSSSPFSSPKFAVLDDPFFNTFHIATEAFSPKLECTPDSSRARRSRMRTRGYSIGTGSIFATDVALSLPPKLKAAENKKKDDVPTALVKKIRGHSKDRVISDNIHRIADSARGKRVVSMQSMNKENLEVEE